MKSIIVSDLHAHNWSAFSSIDGDGVNTRLATILYELDRAVDIATDKYDDVDNMFVCGDIFHTRGKIAPSVLNPTRQAFKNICSVLNVFAIPGNHDLEGKHANTLSNAMQALEDVGVEVITEDYKSIDVGVTDHPMIMVPWHDSQESLRKRLIDLGRAYKKADLIIHAPVNEVIKGIPNTGLCPEWLSTLGFRNVFAGHYHDYKKVGEGVYSVGALTHQTWNDVNTRAGFIIYDHETGLIEHLETGAPKFVTLEEDDFEDFDDRIMGHYVRIKTEESDPENLKKARDLLISKGANGVIFNVQKKHTPIEREVVIDGDLSLSAQLQKYCEAKKIGDETFSMCLDILSEVRTGGA